ncbi:MAG: tRNA (adenosine(37)-N6)-dimethylallyltransferase MiaA [Proteiniphilum sp.]|jgi:tRNA dimethylallyltransferase|nr:tRNA (adenosine(37)-N6)-dimethylallyltransferase MiaA [Proteiniphilum sp.]MDD2726816.1 tRNA (adenosine(37)-N6)-dimethylallyltransferase MiaA [Proteiniphilum sp.]MDD3332813.1 tRNA (adenosine(37)-N6)-dimethylallyltransferase MiaA [Proteiniphilum sp.]MDD3556521.1 tRNA (adenosine(37)-N6)-dimethylallyltransferase MiaA [Proteiniphilum sp.]MDD3979144.1 tRNA (adenosine(37)-N6)-dimethylallyltransferase MiaA [Proteiniphilum sp.]
MMNTLLVLLGPTGVGKTEWSIRIASALNCSIVSADSRQIYRGMRIATAAPTSEQQEQIPHYFVGTLSPETYYSASNYEQDVISLLNELFAVQPVVILSGGSMMYIDALCKGMDELPTVDETLRRELQELYQREGLDPIRRQLKILDPLFYDQVDLKNPKRVIHALEICLMSGRPYSAMRTRPEKKRAFRIVKIGFTRDRNELYNRINHRVDAMVEEGIVEEARGFYPQRHLNALNTVGYKELFQYFDGEWTLVQAIDKIKQHSRNYARKQLTWFNKDQEIHWINLSESEPDVMSEVMRLLEQEG